MTRRTGYSRQMTGSQGSEVRHDLDEGMIMKLQEYMDSMSECMM